MKTSSYETDLTDDQWAILSPFFAVATMGRPRQYSYRSLINAMLYVLRSGCHWRLLPYTFPPWNTVYHSCRRWRRDGTWQRIHTALRERVRTSSGRAAQPSACMLDSQSVKTTGVGGPRGYDGGKHINGRKRHIVVDTQGWLLAATVHTADIQDRAGVPLVLENLHEAFPRIEQIWVDQGYTGQGKAWIEDHLGWRVEVVARAAPRRWTVLADGSVEKVPVARGFAVLPKRWIVERTFSWLGQNRRLSKDYERTCATSEAWMLVAMIRVMVRRLTRPPSASARQVA